MDKTSSTKQLVLSGLFIAMGIVLPMTFHTVGAGGPAFLPMHIPVLIAGFCLDLPYALAVGIMTPALSAILTGMPPLFPTLPFMLVELATYGAAVSLLYRTYKQHVLIALIGAMINGRIMAGLVVWLLTTFFVVQLPGPVLFVKGAVTTGIPGIIIQLIFIPIVVIALERYKVKK